MDLLARAHELEAQGQDIVHMEVGEPDFPTPTPIVNAGIAALQAGKTSYTPAAGLPELRQAIADHYLKTYQLDMPASRILVTPGASGALQLALAVSVNPGDKVMLADPGYPCNRHFAALFEAEVIAVPVSAKTDYQLNAELLAEHWDDAVRVVMLASPSNPTGSIIADSELQAMVDFVEKHQALLIVDEIYHGLCYGDKPDTALKYSDKVFVVNSFSKYFGMTGWRLGWLVAPENRFNACDRLAQNIFLAAATPSQHAALAAFSNATKNIVENRCEEYRQRRDYLLPQLTQLGFDVKVKPEGAFYIYAGCEKFSDDSLRFCQDLLENIGVAITPGIDFGNNKPETHVRFAYTSAMDRLELGIQRMQSYLK